MIDDGVFSSRSYFSRILSALSKVVSSDTVGPLAIELISSLITSDIIRE